MNEGGNEMVRTRASVLRAFGLLSALALTVAAVGATSLGLQDAPQSSRNSCDVLTKKEVEEVLNAKVSDPIRRGDACHFEPAGRPARGIIVTVYWTGGERRMESTNMSDSIVRSAVGNDKKFVQSNEGVKDLGDDASFPMKTLNVLKGDVLLQIDADRCTRQQAIALARKALARI